MSTNDTITIEIDSILHSVKFAVLLTLEIPSILLSFVIFAYFALNRRARSMDHNHSILLLLSINFLQVITDLPMPMSFFQSGGITRPATSAYCTWWIWYEFSLNNINGFLMAWISIERHLLIFHAHLIRRIGTWKRWSLHVAPLIVFSLWGPMFYILTVVASPMCTNTWQFNRLLCGLPCYLLSTWGSFDLFLNIIFPVSMIVIANLTLVARVIHQQMIVVRRTRIDWYRQRRMVLQLGIHSTLYLTIWFPVSIALLGEIYINPNFLLPQLDTIDYCIYFVPLLLPFACLISMPKLIKKLKTMLFQRPHIAVAPATFKLNRWQGANNMMVAGIGS